MGKYQAKNILVYNVHDVLWLIAIITLNIFYIHRTHNKHVNNVWPFLNDENEEFKVTALSSTKCTLEQMWIKYVHVQCV